MSMQADSATANWCGGVLLMIGLTGCGGYETAYERAVYAAEPVYCYRTVADPDCYRAADPTANRRLVNYYGPSPSRAKAPRPAEIRLDPPPPAETAAASGSGRRPVSRDHGREGATADAGSSGGIGRRPASGRGGARGRALTGRRRQGPAKGKKKRRRPAFPRVQLLSPACR